MNGTRLREVIVRFGACGHSQFAAVLIADAAGERSVWRRSWVCFPVVCCHTQGRLAEARLTLGCITQPRWGWCVAEW